MPGKIEIIGDYKNLLNYMKEDAYAKIDKTVDQALKEAEELLAKKLEEVYAPLEVEVERILDEAQQRINAEKAALEMERKKKVEELKKIYVNKVIEEAWRRLLEEAQKGSEKYKNLLKNALIRMSKEAEGDEVEVYALKKDLEYVKKVIEENKLSNLTVGGSAEEKGIEIKGGVVGKSKKAAVWYNYSLERLFEEVVQEVYSEVLEALTS
ncbi:V-type ATP synthase subunit E [Ignicoccus pacificus DSM 13166]|uniref:A-type ATP synthase subunit E n=1 Tax=Ignicoccus pacificus DSM 13166 TaxID=940294 RepID=A0A977KB29_9CREN|nr:V-type ATP synthase subunit E [Ignicoccus pacificus DSM 13166]